MAVPFKKIMLTLDGSDLALQALPEAVAIAERFDAELILFQVLHDLERKTALLMMDEDRKQLQAGIDRHQDAMASEAADSLRQLAGTLDLRPEQVTVLVEVGDAEELIVKCSHKRGVDMVVMCTHGRTGLKRQLYGSVAEYVLLHANCPVLLVRSAISK